MRKKIIVIGGGIGGLAVACRLAARGNKVDLLEKRDCLGGKASGLEINGFKFDSGLSILSAPFMIDDLFSEAGMKTSDYVHLIPIDPAYRVFANDGKVFTRYRDSLWVQQQIERLNPVDKVGYNRYTIRSENIFKRFFAGFATKPAGFLQSLELMIELFRQGEHVNLYELISNYFSDTFIRNVFAVSSLNMGCNPFNIPGYLSMMHYIEKEWGYYYPRGGIGSLVSGLQRLFEQMGGTVSLNTEIQEIIFKGRTAVGVRLTDRTIQYADVIVSDVDTPYLYQTMLSTNPRLILPEWRVQNADYSMSYFILYLGVKRRYLDSNLVHQNVFLSRDFRANCDAIFTEKNIPQDMTLFVSMPTFSDITIAPPSHEIIKIMIPVPNLGAGIDWDKTARPYRDKVLRMLEENYLPNLRSNIVVEHHITPFYFQQQLNCHMGAACSMQPTILQSGWLRPHNRAMGLENLFLVGDGAQPGPGFPSVLLSAKNVADMI